MGWEKTKLYRNILTDNYKTLRADRNVKQITVVCRGCSTNETRCMRWEKLNEVFKTNNQQLASRYYLMLEEYPENAFNKNTVYVVVGGKLFGTIGYIAAQFAVEVKVSLQTCENYRVDMLEEYYPGKKEIKLILSFRGTKAIRSTDKKVKIRYRFAANLKSLMAKQNISQQQLAALSKLSPVSISSYVNAKRLPSTPSLIKLTNVLGNDIADILQTKEGDIE